MDVERIIRKWTEGKRLSIEAGSGMMLKIQGVQGDLKSIFVGMEPGNYLVIRIPRIGAFSKKINEGSQLIARYVHNGMVYGFQSTILGYFNKEQLLLLVASYPKVIETHNLRKDQRVDCYFPAALEVNGTPFEGVVVDISPNGCRFCYEKIEEKRDLKVELNQDVTIHCQLVGIEGARKLSGKVVNMASSHKSVSVGFMLEGLDPSISEAINGYISQVSLNWDEFPK